MLHRRFTSALLNAGIVLAFAFFVRPAVAQDQPAAAFALIVGSNVSVDRELPRLHYADDDAARYFDLFRLLGMRTELLARVDDNTARLHPQAGAEASLPHWEAFDRAVGRLAEEVRQARQRGFATVFYFVFAGHGGVENERGYIALEDKRLTGETLGSELVSRIGADVVHIIIDACDSYLVAYSRGPGASSRRPVHDFVRSVYELGRDPRVGLLLSTSAANETHEWDVIQAGVFSHEVRSGLYGAADADGDGEVTYREIAAFVSRANEAVENEHYRPRVFARPPFSREVLLDLRKARGRMVTVDGAHAGRYAMEDARGVRLADFHNPAGQSVLLVRPAPVGRTFLRRLDVDAEFTIPPGDGPLDVASLEAEPQRTAPRGALHESFSRLFLLPFDVNVVEKYAEPPAPYLDLPSPKERPRMIVGWSLLGLGCASVGVGTYFAIHGTTIPLATVSASGTAVAARNMSVSQSLKAATWSFIGGGVAAAAGAIVLLWPNGTASVQATVSSTGLSVGGTF
jgi:hypothetical protein